MQKGGVLMFRDLARMTASLKGPRYEGALIAKAVWECGHDAGAGMRILRNHHGLLEVMAFDDSGRLTLTMLLGRPAPSRPSGRLVRSRSLKLLVDGAPPPAHLSLCFSAESVHAFGPKPLVPGLAILEAALQGIAPVRRAELRFRGASFAGETIELSVQQRM